MFYIALAIVIAGYLISQAITQTITRVKQRELEANPEFRKKEDLEWQLTCHKRDSDGWQKKLLDAMRKRDEAVKNGDEKEAKNWENWAEKYIRRRNSEDRRIEEINKQLSSGITRPVFKYNFKIKRVWPDLCNFSSESQDLAKIYLNDEHKKKFKELEGLPISIILEDSGDFPYTNTFTARCRAEDKASELVATIMGITYGGGQPYQPYQKDYWKDEWLLKGKFVGCDLISIDQLQ